MPALKRVKNMDFVHPDDIHTINNEDNEDEVEEVERTSALARDVSGEEFTRQKSCMLGSEIVIGNTDFLKLGEFDFRSFHMQAVRKVEKATDDHHTNSAWVSSTAIISYNRSRASDNLTVAIDDESGWKKVEQGVKRWMLERRKSITVKLTIQYKKGISTNCEDLDENKENSAKV